MHSPPPRRPPVAPDAPRPTSARRSTHAPRVFLCTLAVVAALVALAALVAGPRAAGAQYFGQNRVRYDRKDARVLRTQHFDVHYDRPAEAAAREAARMAERWYARLSPMFGGHEFRARKPIVLYSNHPDFQQTNLTGDAPNEGTRGFAEAVRDRIVMPLAGLAAETDHVLGHEVVHLFQFDVAERAAGGAGAAFALPLWFVEGQAEYLALGRVSPTTTLWVRAALARGELPTLARLGTDPRFFPYRWGHAFWAFVHGRWGDEAGDALYRAALRSGIPAAIAQVLGVSLDEFDAAWHAAIQAEYAGGMAERAGPEAFATRLPGDDAAGAADALQLAPALSPDGTRIAYLARRGPFGLDLVLADVRTGRVLRTLAGPSNDPHGDAVSFLYASGAWSPDGRRFAHVVVRRGDHELVLSDVERGDRRQRLRVRGVQSISAVAWSPDGRRLAVAGTRHGQPDLWLLDLETRQLTRVTDDPWAELQPAWSPDGRWLAVATDWDGAGRLAALDFPALRVMLLDPVSGRRRALRADSALAATLGGAVARRTRISDPQWSPDGRFLHVVADPEGVPDLFRLDLATGAVQPLTRLATGASGLTERSPALSVARESGALVFTAFDGAAYRLYALDPERAVQAMGPTAVATPALPVAPTLALLPPGDAVETSAVTAYLDDPDAGLPGPTGDVPFTRPYRGGLTFEGFGSPGIGVAGGALGAAVGGGASAVFGDLLGRRRLVAAVQGQGRVQDVGGQLLYLNTATRWNWFASLGRTPLRTGSAASGPAVVNVGGVPTEALLQEQVALRTVVHQASLGAQYPFSRTLRAEVSVTGTRQSRTADIDRVVVVGGRAFRDAVRGVDAGTRQYGQLSGAFVRDAAVFGATSPVRGSRWRVEVGQTLGELSHGTVLADLRRYVFVRPFTLALRGFHFGRYGRHGDSPFFAPLSLGDGALVRGYGGDTFTAADCSRDPARPGVCPEIARLTGSRVAAASAELRVALSGVRGLSVFGRGPALELAPFADAGMAWRPGDTGRLAFDRLALDRVPVVSAGLAARLNLRTVIVEAFWAHPFQRPGRSGVFGFALAPGW